MPENDTTSQMKEHWVSPFDRNKFDVECFNYILESIFTEEIVVPERSCKKNSDSLNSLYEPESPKYFVEDMADSLVIDANTDFRQLRYDIWILKKAHKYSGQHWDGSSILNDIKRKSRFYFYNESNKFPKICKADTIEDIITKGIEWEKDYKYLLNRIEYQYRNNIRAGKKFNSKKK
ncbi:hypothetical protein DASC09_061830 [Saccharomycopsis crataegensis]|uniref:Uncharacterized protein n=1 Tax=Saccharomycopsis crataegensis TaxID=43959 RepID=A0AAV5QVW6_9ASCO|nr:hypothetical protein DASC09_061830 [Saccharomycopsis crataegensis]